MAGDLTPMLGHDEPDGDEGGYGDGALDSMKAFIEAVNDGDAEKALMHFRDVKDQCDEDGGSGPPKHAALVLPLHKG